MGISHVRTGELASVNNSSYLEWALTLSRPGALINADNIVRHGRTYQNPPPDASSAGAAEYTRKILEHPRLVSVALLNDDVYNGIDGFSISVVRQEAAEGAIPS